MERQKDLVKKFLCSLPGVTHTLIIDMKQTLQRGCYAKCCSLKRQTNTSRFLHMPPLCLSKMILYRPFNFTYKAKPSLYLRTGTISGIFQPNLSSCISDYFHRDSFINQK